MILTKTKHKQTEGLFIIEFVKKQNRIIYSQRMAGYLMQKGFVLISMQPDLKKSGRNVFFFVDTPQLKSAIDEYMSR